MNNKGLKIALVVLIIMVLALGGFIVYEKVLNKNNNVILDVPLLFESKLNKICNFTVAVIAKEEIKINRITNRDNTNENIAKARLNIQPNDEFYKKRASFIIENNENLEKIDLEEICTKIGKN